MCVGGRKEKEQKESIGAYTPDQICFFFCNDYLRAEHRPNKELPISLVLLHIIWRTQDRVRCTRFKIIRDVSILTKGGETAEDEVPTEYSKEGTCARCLKYLVAQLTAARVGGSA